VFVALPADTVHAGGLCFGSKMKCPTKTSKMRGNKIFFQNQHLHFTFCCSEMADKESNGETHITIVGDNKKPLEKILLLMKKLWISCWKFFWIGIQILCHLQVMKKVMRTKLKILIKFPRPMFLP